MSFNPFCQKPGKAENLFMDWKDLAPKPYDKNEVSPYTKARIILMNGAEYEAVWHGHQTQRMCGDNDVRRELAFIRKSEQQQQKMIAALKPADETQLETTIAYEQLAVDLTAFMAQRSKDKHVKAALDFALLEDFDHLYRYAELLENDSDIHAEKLVGRYTEIMPGRPTIAHHRHPMDEVKQPLDGKTADFATLLDTHIITAAEQQTMNYYMNLGAFYKNDYGRKLYTEIGMVEEQHVTQYGSLIPVDSTPSESCLMHEYVECYLYYSMYEDESDPLVKKIWERCLDQEIIHLHKAAELLRKTDKKDWREVIPNGDFPELVKLGSNIEYVRKVLAKTVNNTADRESYVNINKLPKSADFFSYQRKVNTSNVNNVASHKITQDYMNRHGKDYRFETGVNPVKDLRDRQTDNTSLGRLPTA